MDSIAQNAEKLFEVSMLGADIPDWEYEKDVHLWFFVTDRQDGPPMPYEKAIEDYDPQDDCHVYPEGCVDEQFTLDEAQALKKWLVSSFGNDAHVEITERSLPIEMNEMGLGALPFGGLTGQWTFYRWPAYDLPFKVAAYYDRRESKALDESRKLNRQIAVRARDGQIKYMWDASRIEEHQRAITVIADVLLSNEQIAAELRKIADQFEQNNAEMQKVRWPDLPELEFAEGWSCFNLYCGVCGQGCESGHGIDVVLAETKHTVCPDCIKELLSPDQIAELEKKRKEASARFQDDIPF